MTNEEIRAKIGEYQNEIRKVMLAGTFELNTSIEKYKNKINALRDQCTHKNENGAITYMSDGRCPYCSRKVK